MLTSAKALKRQIIRVENDIYYLKRNGDPDERLPWLTTYHRMLLIRHERAEAAEKKIA